MKIYKFSAFLFMTLLSMSLSSQGSFSGDLMLNTSFFMRDSIRGAAGIPHYDNSLKGTNSWLQLNYSTDGLEMGVRLDIYNNSNLHNPSLVYSDGGIGAWYVRKSMKKLTIQGGYIYDQFGSGIAFRAYEDRGLGIDNALMGVHLKYNLSENVTVTAMTGRQKYLFDFYSPIIIGGKIEGFKSVGDYLNLNPGFGVMNRALDEASMTSVVTQINSYALEDRFVPKYNVYSGAIYNTLSYKRWTWYVEYALKSNEAIQNIMGKLIDTDGSVVFSTLGYSKKGIGIIGQYKRVENYDLRVNPDQILLKGMLNYLPPLTRQNTYRLTSRYAAACLPLGEEAFQVDIVTKPRKGLNIDINVSHVRGLEGEVLFNEIYVESKIKVNKKLKIIPGMQYMEYNRQAYESKGGMIYTKTPFLETIYKLSRKKSIRTEWSYQHTKQDFGSWAWALLEYNVAPNWSFSVSDMYNIEPKKGDKLHYPSVFAGYTNKGNRYTLAYVKQVEGIVCTGGVCRYEPAFSGVRLSVSSSF